MNRVPIAAGAVIVALSFASQACSKSEAAETSRSTPVVTLVAEDIATVERRELPNGPVISGTLTARRRATVRAEVGGLVSALYADRGTEVAAGAPLLRIEGRAFRDAQIAAITEASADEESVALVKRRLTRAQALLAGGAISADEVDDARQALTSAEAKLAATRARLSAATEALEHTLIRAPFAGIISARPVNTGDIIESGNVVFEVLDPTTMYLESSVPAVEIGTIHVGAPVQFNIAGYPARTFSGRIERVNPAADPTTRQIPVFIAIDNAEGKLVAGLFAEGRLAPSNGPALLVPGAAIDRDGSSPVVVRLVGGRIERRHVETGRQDPDGAVVEIRSGLTLGDTIVLGVSRALPTGTSARIAGSKPAPTTASIAR